MKLVQHILIQSIDADQRLDRFLKRKFPVLKQSQIEKICRKGEVRIDGGRCKPATRLVQGNEVRVPPLKSNDISLNKPCLLYTSPSPRDYAASRMPSSA